MRRRPFDPVCGLDIATTTFRTLEDLARVQAWGYRLMHHDSGELFVHEVYYGAEGELVGIARVPAAPCGDTPGEVGERLDQMREALDEPPLRYRDHVSGESDGPR